MSLINPPEYTFGKVVCRVVRSVADTVVDSDYLPDIEPVTGQIIFNPAVKMRKVLGDYKSFVSHEIVTCELDSEGFLVDSTGRQGIWLVTGLYNVQFKLSNGSISPFDISVEDTYTADNPLDLVSVVPYEPTPGDIVKTVVIPADGTDGQYLAITNGVLKWQDGVPQVRQYKEEAEQLLYASSTLYKNIGNVSGNIPLNIYDTNVIVHMTLTGNVSFISLPLTPTPGMNITLVVKQNTTGGNTISFPENVFTSYAAGIGITSVANAIDIIHLFYTGEFWTAYLGGANIK